MNEIVEQAAKAMWDTRRAHANNAGIDLEVWGDGTIPKANGIMAEARAALESIREPTEDMANAAECAEPFSFEAMWKAAIDAALLAGEHVPTDGRE